MELSREWARRGNHFAELFFQSDDPATFHYGPHDPEYTETLEWHNWATAQDADSEVFAKLIEIRAFRPKRVDCSVGGV